MRGGVDWFSVASSAGASVGMCTIILRAIACTDTRLEQFGRYEFMNANRVTALIYVLLGIGFSAFFGYIYYLTLSEVENSGLEIAGEIVGCAVGIVMFTVFVVEACLRCCCLSRNMSSSTTPPPQVEEVRPLDDYGEQDDELQGDSSSQQSGHQLSSPQPAPLP